ncbi:hypothetical protein [Streptomyces graminilatus]|uniref:hypothetical protein n=1 Tax=Streptomyces graminilatus TaxID=1464070 RepID=UPI001F526448|nr:hypothetical protein [Streptomyces graminilatus]
MEPLTTMDVSIPRTPEAHGGIALGIGSIRGSTRRLLAEDAEAGDAWLADCSARPDLVRDAWSLEALAPIRSGAHWLVAESRLVAGMEALSRIREERRGPVLVDTTLDRAWWLMPPDSGRALDCIRGIRAEPWGMPLHCPPTGRQACGRIWLHRPDGSGRLTAPAILAAALGPVGTPLTEASR